MVIWQKTSCDPLTLRYLTFGAGAHAQGTSVLRPQFGPNAQPRQTSWSKKSPTCFCKPQESCPVDNIKSVQWERVITEDRSSEYHCALHWATKWIEVSSSSWQRRHTASFRRPMILRCRLRSAWSVSNPTRFLKSFFSGLKAKRARPLSGVFKNSLACLHLGNACHSLLCSWIAHELTELVMWPQKSDNTFLG